MDWLAKLKSISSLPLYVERETTLPSKSTSEKSYTVCDEGLAAFCSWESCSAFCGHAVSIQATNMATNSGRERRRIQAPVIFRSSNCIVPFIRVGDLQFSRQHK